MKMILRCIWVFSLFVEVFSNIAAVKNGMVFSHICSLVQSVNYIYLSYLPNFSLVQKK